MADAVNSAESGRAGINFYLPFDSNATAAVTGGNPAPLVQSKPGKTMPDILGGGVV